MYISASIIRQQRVRLAAGHGTECMRQAKIFSCLFFCGSSWASYSTGWWCPPPLLTINNIALIYYTYMCAYTGTKERECSFLFHHFFAAPVSSGKDGGKSAIADCCWQPESTAVGLFLITGSYQSLPLISSSSWVVVVSSPMIGDSFRCWRTIATTLYMASMVAVGIDISTKTTIYAHTNNKAKGLKVELTSINNTIPRYYTWLIYIVI